ncbi:MAG: hypothetical protein JO115_16335 [Pseudonocardiales bacterium]|nr:hypothetical protein [Pseudonocardiales bacterium]
MLRVEFYDDRLIAVDLPGGLSALLTWQSTETFCSPPAGGGRMAVPASCAFSLDEHAATVLCHLLTMWLRPRATSSKTVIGAGGAALTPSAPSPVHATHEMGYELMLVVATVADNATAEIIKDTGKLLTISIPHGPLPVYLVVDPPGAVRLTHLLAKYAQKAQPPE